VDVVLRTTSSGWTELPAIADMASIQLGHSSAQILGKLVPVAETTLAAGDGMYFPGQNLLWQEPQVRVSSLPLKGAWKRMRAGLPVVMLQAEGPGRIAFSHDSPGEMLAVPLQPGQAVDVREHQMVAATSAVAYDWYDSGLWFTTRGDSGSQQGGAGLLKVGLSLLSDDDGGDDRREDEIRWVYPVGQFVDRFIAGDQPGAVLVQCGGDAFTRTLAEGESILVKPPSLLVKDPSVAMQLHVEFPHAGKKFWRSWGNRYLWLRLWGPGRVVLQSCYERLEDPGNDFQDSCQYTQQAW
jgi:uncharacterized protein (AIM24 family)